MAEHTLYGKNKLCYTDTADFTSFQGIGNNPLYRRYESVFGVIKKIIPAEYQNFLAQPVYSEIDDKIYWYTPEWKVFPIRYNDLPDGQKEAFDIEKNAAIKVFQNAKSQLTGEEQRILAGAIKFMSDDFIYCVDGKPVLVAWGMEPDKNKHVTIGHIIHEDFLPTYSVSFQNGDHGKLDGVQYGIKKIEKKHGESIFKAEVPNAIPDEGYKFSGWNPANPIGTKIAKNTIYIAQYEKIDGEGENASETPIVPVIPQGSDVVNGVKDDSINNCNGSVVPGVEEPTKLHQTPIAPIIEPEPLSEKKAPWYKRFWKWLCGGGCLKALLWFLLIILLLFLISWLLRACATATVIDTVAPVETITNPDGSTRDDNGTVGSITDERGELPDNGAISPIVGDDGQLPPVISEPGGPSVIANRLVCFFDDDDADLNQWSKDFKGLYPSDDYSIVGYDPNAKMIVIQIPEAERNGLREKLPNQLSNYNFFIVDETLYQREQSNGGGKRGWHIDAINVQSAWKTTTGSANVIVGIVDDGIEASHPAFEGRYYNPYNVFTQNNKLSRGSGHGTHVASLAAGSASTLSQGVAGVAPSCKIMPIQVFDGDFCSMSSLICGIMYAVHNNADVVNISIGPSFNGLSDIVSVVAPGEQGDDLLEEISRTTFKNEEKVFNRVVEIATRKNVVLVFAAGNDNVLAYLSPENRQTNSISVAAVNASGKQSLFSNYGAGADISAPGENIYAAWLDNGYKAIDGTSMAAPIVTGTIALMKSIKKDLTPAQTLATLQQTSKKVVGKVPGMIQADKAVACIASGNIPDASHVKDSGTISNGSSSPDSPESDGSGSSDNGVSETNNPNNTDSEAVSKQKDEKDYSSIRALIEEYKKKIADLEKQLPENK